MTAIDIVWDERVQYTYPDFVKAGAAGLCGGNIVYAGGLKIPWRESEACYAVDPDMLDGTSRRNLWSPLPPLPVGMGYTNGIATGGKLYVAGSRKMPDATLRNTYALECRDGQYAWTELAPMLEGRMNHAVACTPEMVIAVGGGTWNSQFPGSAFPDGITAFIEAYMIAENKWVSLSEDRTKARTETQAACAGHSLYMFGGYRSYLKDGERHIDYYKDAYRFDLRTGQWERRKDTPIVLCGGVALNYKDRYMIIVGGVHQPGEEMTYCFDEKRGVQVGELGKKVVVYDIESDEYDILPAELPRGAADVRVCLHNSKLYVIGGETSDKTLMNTACYVQVGEIRER